MQSTFHFVIVVNDGGELKTITDADLFMAIDLNIHAHFLESFDMYVNKVLDARSDAEEAEADRIVDERRAERDLTGK